MYSPLEWHDQAMEEHLLVNPWVYRRLKAAGFIDLIDDGERPLQASPAEIRALHNGEPEEEDRDACD